MTALIVLAVVLCAGVFVRAVLAADRRAEDEQRHWYDDPARAWNQA